MSRILAIDYGRKRVGIAVTDPLQMIANSLTTIHSKDVWIFLAEYCAKEDVCCIVVGYPKQMNNMASEAVRFINPFVKKLVKTYPDMQIKLVDERFTSKIAHQTMREAGLKKKARQDKALVDMISATIILQSYLEQKSSF